MELVKIAVFSFSDDPGVLESILQSENIPYFLNNENMSVIFSPAISRTLTVNEQDKERAIDVIKEAGFGKYIIDYD